MSDWQNVTWIEAANAFAAGTHDIKERCMGGDWEAFDSHSFVVTKGWQYRIREKQRTITVTIPRPDDFVAGGATFGFYDVGLRYKTTGDAPGKAQFAYDAIRAAMEQQP